MCRIFRKCAIIKQFCCMMLIVNRFFHEIESPGILQIQMDLQDSNESRPIFLEIVRDQFKHQEDKQITGAYILIDSVSDEDGSYRMYVGVSRKGKVLNRMSSHKREPSEEMAWWRLAIVVYGYMDESSPVMFSEEEAKAMEHLLYERLIRHEVAKLTNIQTPTEPSFTYSMTAGTDPKQAYEEVDRLNKTWRLLQTFIEPTVKLIETKLGYVEHGKRKKAVDGLTTLLEHNVMKSGSILTTSSRSTKHFAEARISPSIGYIEIMRYGKDSDDSWIYNIETGSQPLPFLDLHTAADLVTERKNTDGWKFWFDEDGTSLKDLKDRHLTG